MENEVNVHTLFLNSVRKGDSEDEGEGKFGLTPPMMNPIGVAVSQTLQAFNGESALRPHPLLSKTSQFSGVDKHLTPNPAENANAQEIYPQLRFQKRQEYKNKATPTLTR